MGKINIQKIKQLLGEIEFASKKFQESEQQALKYGVELRKAEREGRTRDAKGFKEYVDDYEKLMDQYGKVINEVLKELNKETRSL